MSNRAINPLPRTTANAANTQRKFDAISPSITALATFSALQIAAIEYDGSQPGNDDCREQSAEEIHSAGSNTELMALYCILNCNCCRRIDRSYPKANRAQMNRHDQSDA